MRQERLQRLQESIQEGRKAAADLAAPYLRPGEQIEIVTTGTVFSVSLRRNLATGFAIGMATGLATGGLLVATRVKRPRRMWLVFTSERLIFFDGETGRLGELLFTFLREAVSVAKVKKVPYRLRVELAIQGQRKGLRVVLPQKEGELLAAALRPAAAAPAAAS